MFNNKNLNYSDLRKFVSKLYIAVLTEKITVKDALLSFPKYCQDKTIVAAWHALCHLEADEDIRKRDKLYAQEQDDYIEYIAYTLHNGEELPMNIINAYPSYHYYPLIPSDKSFKGIISQFKKFLC